jgi:hypothetical protein
MRTLLFGTLLVVAVAAPPAAQTPVPATAAAAPALSDSQIEQFLTEGKIERVHNISKGVTNSRRATLSDGTLTHDAQIQDVDEHKSQFVAGAQSEFNFIDSWQFNIAAYRLDRLIGLNLVPPSVERRFDGKSAAFTWWVDDVIMDEGGRLKDKARSPRPGEWNEQMQLVRVFDQLIYNMDRNLGNLLIDKNWRVWAIDHTRAFRLYGQLKSPDNVTRCDRAVFEKMKQLDKDTLEKTMGRYLTGFQIKALLERRDAIVHLLEAKGPTALFDRQLQ